MIFFGKLKVKGGDRNTCSGKQKMKCWNAERTYSCMRQRMLDTQESVVGLILHSHFSAAFQVLKNILSKELKSSMFT